MDIVTIKIIAKIGYKYEEASGDPTETRTPVTRMKTWDPNR